jgi:hypothetical protein
MGDAVVFSGCQVEAEEDPWKVVNPVHHGAAGPEHVLAAAVETLHHPIGLRWYAVVWLCWMLSKSHRAAHREEVNWDPVVQWYDCWYFKSAEPSLKHGIRAIHR